MNSAEIIQALPTFFVGSAGDLDSRAHLALLGAEQSFPLLARLVAELGHQSLQPTRIEDFGKADSARVAGSELATLFNHYGSDKAGLHNYNLLYGAILSRPKYVKRLLEVGLGTNNEDVVSNMTRHGRPGASLRAFRDFLPEADIVGADVDRRILFSEDRIKTFYVDQTDISTLDHLATQVPIDFDLIIDDGLHSPSANLASLIFGLARLRVGGCMVVEDILEYHLPVWQVVAALLPAASWRVFLVKARITYMFVVQRVDHWFRDPSEKVLLDDLLIA